MFFSKKDDALRMRWALVCSVSDSSMVDSLSEFSIWFLSKVTDVAARANIYARFEERPKIVQHVPVDDYGACASAYENITKDWPSVMCVLHILPHKNAQEYEWMRSLSTVHGFIRQGVLLENALDRFASASQEEGHLDMIFMNVAQWFMRATSRLSIDKDITSKPYDMRVGAAPPMPVNMKYDQDVIQKAVNAVLSGRQDSPPLHRDESAVFISGFPSSFNEFGIAQLFNGLKVTGVNMNPDRTTVTFATKFLAYQACCLDGKRLDRFHILRIEPLCTEVRDQIMLKEVE